MSETQVTTGPAPTLSTDNVASVDPRQRTLLLRVATISGLVAMLAFILTPFLPVNQVQSSLSWPQSGTLDSVSAPLESYAPEYIDVDVPVAAIAQLREGEDLLVGTLPQDSDKAFGRGLFVRSFDGSLDVAVRGDLLLDLTKEEVAALPDDAVIKVSSHEDGTTAEIPGASDPEGNDYIATTDDDMRPQVTGIYTEIDSSAQAASLADAGLAAHVEINSRYTSSPTFIKTAAMYLGGLLTLVAMACVFRLDRLDGRGRIPWLRPGAFRPTGLDAVVGALLGYWYIFGANTSDDGFILTMARASADSSYMANYYRWFGVPESPFGAPYYDLLGVLARVSTASMWMRLPSLIAAVVIWFMLSRMVMPLLGDKIDGRRVAHWTAAFVFLAFWQAYNNGLRPEPIIALGSLATWLLFERAIATRRLFPGVVGTAVAAFTLACGPTGLMAVAALLACFSQILRLIHHKVITLIGADASSSPRAKRRTWIGLLAPFFAAGFSVLIAVFGDQTLRTVTESISVRADKGPSLRWYFELVRYQTLMSSSVDGSYPRRLPFLMVVVAFIVVIASMLRNGKVPGSSKDPARRLTLIIAGTVFFLMFTPTKWSHHFGIYAGLGAALAGLAAVALSQVALRSLRTRVLVAGGMLFVFALALAGPNGWWYTSSYAIPWWDKTIQFKEIEAATVMLLIAMLVLFAGVVLTFRKDFHKDDVNPTAEVTAPATRRTTLIASAPIAVLCALTVLFNSAVFAKAFISQYPAYTVGLGNLRSLGGDTCALADDVLVETNSNDSFLTPLEGSLADSLGDENTRGFDPNRISVVVNDEIDTGRASSAQEAKAGSVEDSTTGDSDTVRTESGANGSNANLPFNLDYTSVPVLGSYTEGQQYYAETTTSWYSLPARSEDAPLLVVSAAGRIKHFDTDGIEKEGQDLFLQYGRTGDNGEVDMLGETRMLDIGPENSWRNLRLPLDDLPAEADVVRIHAIDSSLDSNQWLAFTPPRVPSMDTLNNVVGSTAPVLLDWAVPLQFPCQRPFSHYAGVVETPEYRITADYDGKMSGASFEDYDGGGVLGTAEAVNYSYQLPAYAKDDWQRDWGSIEVYNPYTNSVGEAPQQAVIDEEIITRSGLWYPGAMNVDTSQ